MPKDISIEKLSLEYAIKLLSMPFVLGLDPDTNEEIKVGIGRFGPYIERAGKYTSLKKHNPTDITLTEALDLLTESANKQPRKYIKKKS